MLFCITTPESNIRSLFTCYGNCKKLNEEKHVQPFNINHLQSVNDLMRFEVGKTNWNFSFHPTKDFILLPSDNNIQLRATSCASSPLYKYQFLILIITVHIQYTYIDTTPSYFKPVKKYTLFEIKIFQIPMVKRAHIIIIYSSVRRD